MGTTVHVNDVDTGLTYMQQRYYDPVAGRFLSVDPVMTDVNTAASFNRYVYANNNPYRFIDPDGREVLNVDWVKGYGGGFTIGYNRQDGELAISVRLAAGLAGGVSLDTRKGENGRISTVPGTGSDKVAGVTVAAYGSASVGVSTPVLSLELGGKAGGGKDLTSGQNVGGLTQEEGISGPEKLQVKGGIQGGVEVSAYVKVGPAIETAKSNLISNIKSVVKELILGRENGAL